VQLSAILTFRKLIRVTIHSVAAGPLGTFVTARLPGKTSKIEAERELNIGFAQSWTSQFWSRLSS